MRLLYKFTSRSRPQKFIECIDNIYINSRHEDYFILATLDKDDKTMNNEDMIEKMKRYDKLYPIWGESKTKIEAYNRDMEAAMEWDILIATSDDMLFVKNGFDRTIIDDMAFRFPDLDGLLHYNDGNQKDNVITLPIMGKKYYERFNYIYHPSYTSLWCDNEQMDVARKLSKYKYMGDDTIIFRHYHPAWGKGSMDALYTRNESRENWIKDEQNYLTRKQNNFFI